VLILLYGDNRLAIDEHVRDLRARYDPDGFATSFFSIPGDSIEAIRSACLSPGFFGSTRLVVVYDLLVTTAGQRSGRHAAALSPALAELLRDLPESTVLVLVERTLDPGLARAIQRAVPGAVVQQHATPRGLELVEWTIERARRHGSTIDRWVATRLLEALFPASWQRPSRTDDLPPDLYRLDQELAKLAVASLPEGVITSELVGQLVMSEDASDDWALADALAEGDQEAAIRALERALARGAQPEVVLGQLVSQYEAYAVLTSSPAVSLERIARETGLSEGRLRRSQRVVSRLDRAAVAEAVGWLRRLDAAVKLGQAELADTLPAVVQRLAQLAAAQNGATSQPRRASRSSRGRS
jgi:DNA polymerase III delta subunit